MGWQTLFAKAIATVAGVLTLAWTWNTVRARRQRRESTCGGKVRRLRQLWTTVDRCRVHALASPEQSNFATVPVVLVHGFGVSNTYWLPTARRLARAFPVYAPDLPGHGRSDTPRQPLDITQLADRLVAWMDAVGLQRVALVGNSMGCLIAVDAAVRYPDRIERLVLIGPSGDPQARTAVAYFTRLIMASAFERLSLPLILLVDYLRMGPRLIPELRAMIGYRLEEMLPRVTVPVLVARGENDPVAPARWCEEVKRLTGAESVVVVPGWGHAVHHSAPNALADAIEPFLAEPFRQHPLADARPSPTQGRLTSGEAGFAGGSA